MCQWLQNGDLLRSPAKIGSKMGVEFTYRPTWDPIGFDPHINTGLGPIRSLLLSRGPGHTQGPHADVEPQPPAALSTVHSAASARWFHAKLLLFRSFWFPF